MMEISLIILLIIILLLGIIFAIRDTHFYTKYNKRVGHISIEINSKSLTDKTKESALKEAQKHINNQYDKIIAIIEKDNINEIVVSVLYKLKTEIPHKISSTYEFYFTVDDIKKIKETSMTTNIIE